VILSLHERETHCFPDRVDSCRVLLAALEAWRPLREDEYYQLWLSPKAAPPSRQPTAQPVAQPTTPP